MEQVIHQPRRRWSRDAILGALRDWTALEGAPPRRDDWSGAQRRWAREHPRWPSASCVARRFGSWGAALEAAGLGGRRLTFATTPAERVELARRLAASGVDRADIAERLGVSVSSVHNYLHARRCPRCGGPVTNPVAEACIDCTRHLPTVPRTWTRVLVAEAIRDWTRLVGSPPTYRDWTPSRTRALRWTAEHPRWPSASVVSALWSSRPDPWSSAVRDALDRQHHVAA